jgi:hypothetical protein
LIVTNAIFRRQEACKFFDAHGVMVQLRGGSNTSHPGCIVLGGVCAKSKRYVDESGI